MEAVCIHLKEEHGISRQDEWLQLGVPLPEGELHPEPPVALVDVSTGEVINAHQSVMASWPDGSIRWLKLQFSCDLQANAARALYLKPTARSAPPARPLDCYRDESGLRIDTGQATFLLAAKAPAWFASGNQQGPAHQLTLTDGNGEVCQPVADGDWSVLEHSATALICRLTGAFLNGGHRLARFELQLTFLRDSKTLKVDTCIHNPRRARHAGGLWDLGDPGSIHFRSLTINTELANIQQSRITPEPGMTAVELNSRGGALYQDSSGGEHWDSLNHVNAKGEVTTKFRGYRLRIGDHVQMSGDRANPAISVTTPLITVQATLPYFWQNFPSSMGVQDSRLIVGLFPGEAAEAYELQGGERKTQTAYFNYGDASGALAWTLSPAVPVLDAKQYEESQAFPWFVANGARGPLEELIQQGLDGPGNFFAKREVIDEYGWRNFGDIFADHETLYQAEGESPYISHYNNQYDAIYGFARQFALTGDKRWHELMDDLAAHVWDIDIYHTDEDRSEYNHGLFWHTDHYLPAHTATHRTFSRYNNTSSTPGQTGGGPAEQHCYTTGLLYHHFLTGCEVSRQAVLDLANWIVVQREGDHSFLGQLELATRRELPKLKATLRGQRPPDRYYALNRGTGNYLNTLLDAYWLTLDKKWLDRAESVIRCTIHPADDLGERNLSDTETSWSYLVFLASLARYVTIKLATRQCDDEFRYAHACLRLYLDWIYTNEKPFLDAPAKLEFPNDTWVAQDVRKAVLLLQGAALFPDRTEEFKQSGKQWLDYVTCRLMKSPERQMARIQVILLQNAGPHTYLEGPARNEYQLLGIPTGLTDGLFGEQPRLGLLRSALILFRRLAFGLRKFSFLKEKAWLTARLEGR